MICLSLSHFTLIVCLLTNTITHVTGLKIQSSSKNKYSTTTGRLFKRTHSAPAQEINQYESTVHKESNKDELSEDNVTTPGSAVVQSGGAVIQSGGAVVQPGGAVVQSGGAVVQSGGAVVQPGGAVVQSQLERENVTDKYEQQVKNVSMKDIGFTKSKTVEDNLKNNNFTFHEMDFDYETDMSMTDHVFKGNRDLPNEPDLNENKLLHDQDKKTSDNKKTKEEYKIRMNETTPLRKLNSTLALAKTESLDSNILNDSLEITHETLVTTNNMLQVSVDQKELNGNTPDPFCPSCKKPKDLNTMTNQNLTTFESPNSTNTTTQKSSLTFREFEPANSVHPSEEPIVKEKYPDDSADCPHCGSQGLTEDNIKSIRLNFFSKVLRQKLRLSNKNLSDVSEMTERKLPKLPKDVKEKMFRDERQLEEKYEFYARDEEVVITGDYVGHECIKMNANATGCYTFDLTGKNVKRGIKSAFLWFFKSKDRNDMQKHEILLHELGIRRSGRLKEKSLIARMEIYAKDGWISLDLSIQVKKWVDQGGDKKILAIKCSTCATQHYKALYGVKEGYKPVLVVTYLKPRKERRDKRDSETCDPRSRCCKRQLDVDFNAVDLNYIIQPRTMSIGYCFGYCDGMDQLMYNHTAVIQSMRWSSPLSGSLREQLKPCCVPIQLKDSFIITAENGVVTRKLLPNVMVEKCGCM
ncbi:uncharacterized protein LOC106052055 [Biomphalaria glabrata]|uniref:Uncharacterized protein LOC106052055 n=2 Tax=Biomphalaria glabrata TaxID=6526 RepID=A0A9W3ABW9_BIOGL|nr:uncharacterized protein LOC106052055 [Biomphalaria glabrata]KAI8773718.1 growth/differentiation factor 8 [Biomphalaria glabrata]